MHDDDTDIDLDDITLHALCAISPQQITGNERVSLGCLGSPLAPGLPTARPLYRLVERNGDRSPVGYSVLSDVVRSIVNTREKLARWRSGQNGLLCARARRLQLEREEWEA